MLTTADRMRLSGPKVCFVVGAEEGKFPKLAGASGLLTHADRDLLVQNGVQMPGSYENRTLLEQMFFYRALTAAGQRLYVSFTAPEHGGAAVTSALLPAAGALSPGPDELTPAQWAPTPAAALDLYGQRYRKDTPEVSALAAALARDGTMAGSLAAMDAAAHPAPFAARDAAALDVLLGTQMLLSPTRLEQYYRCRFSYFLQYVLHIRPRKKAELSPLESGSLIHYILENAMRRAGARFPTMDKEELAALAGAIADDYVAQNMPQASARFAYLIGRLKRSVTNLLYYLQEEQAQSSFHPVAYEQEIGPGGIPPLTVETPDGKTVQVVGKIDRVDVMQRDGRDYLRVVDYKTGSKTFSLDEVYCGLNTQMLLYLFTLCHAPGALCENPVAAGVLYLAGDPPPKSATRATAAPAPLYKVDGMVLDDEVVLRGMDKAASGLFVPCTFGKDGRRRASAKLASLEKLGNIEKHITGLVLQMARGLYAGEIAASPLRTAAACPCDVCDYRPVCRHEDGVGEVPVTAPKNVFETLPQEGEDV
ncbi:MAG: PD-(D/E)XK nuclease family protein [Rikenellaceae bacterium]|nr:PD-(D/E)XK nuclease family protein [Rikenellaceae bacterium]